MLLTLKGARRSRPDMSRHLVSHILPKDLGPSQCSGMMEGEFVITQLTVVDDMSMLNEVQSDACLERERVVQRTLGSQGTCY